MFVDDRTLELEERIVRAFVDKRYQGRWLMGLSKRTRRRKLPERLCHYEDWDSKYAQDLPVPPGRERVAFLVEKLTVLGAPGPCHLMGGPDDGSTMPVADALTKYLDYGALLVCVPGVLALHLPENAEVIVLHRQDTTASR